MVTEPSLARHGVLPPDGRRIGRLILLLPIGILAAPFAFVALFILHAIFIPAYSASTVIPEVQARLLLRFYYTWGDESGRYLTIATPRDHLTINMTAFDWAHNSRTGVYLTADKKIAILGPMGDDYLVSLQPMRAETPFGVRSEDWVYLGAFDYLLLPYGARELRFMTADRQGECIPMRSEDRGHQSSPRNAARERNCAHYRPARGERYQRPAPSAARPAYFACAPSSCSMRKS